MGILEPLELLNVAEAGWRDDDYLLLLNETGEIRRGEDVLLLPADRTSHLFGSLRACFPFHVLAGPRDTGFRRFLVRNFKNAAASGVVQNDPGASAVSGAIDGINLCLSLESQDDTETVSTANGQRFSSPGIPAGPPMA